MWLILAYLLPITILYYTIIAAVTLSYVRSSVPAMPVTTRARVVLERYKGRAVPRTGDKAPWRICLGMLKGYELVIH